MTAAEIFMWGIRRIEEDMVDGFPYEVPEEYRNMPLLKGRASVDMKVKIKDNPNIEDCVFRIVLDGYNAPVTAGNFVDLVERHFYDGMEIQRCKTVAKYSFAFIYGIEECWLMCVFGFSWWICGTNGRSRGSCGRIYRSKHRENEDGSSRDYGDWRENAFLRLNSWSKSLKISPCQRLILYSLLSFVWFLGVGEQELGLYKAQVVIPFNAFGTMAMAREVSPFFFFFFFFIVYIIMSYETYTYWVTYKQEFENDSGSSQVFWLLKESELTPSNSNILDGRYAVFGYVTDNEDFLADLKVGDVIESIQVVSGLENLANPSYKIAG